MTVARTVADVLSEHVGVRGGMHRPDVLNVYQPKLQYRRGLVGYVHRQLGLPIASTAPLAKITDRFVAAVHRFAETTRFRGSISCKGQRKDDVMHEHLAEFLRREGVVFIGRAQEKTSVFRTEKRRHADGETYPWIVKSTGMINHFYFYCVDGDFGPFFLKFCSYFPYNAKLCLNGNHWAQRQAAKAGSGSPDGQRVRRRRGPGRGAGDLRPARTGADPGAAGQMVGDPAEPIHRADRDAGYRYDCRSCRPSSP